MLPLLWPVSSAAAVRRCVTAGVESAALYAQTSAAESASAPGSLLSLERGQPQIAEPRWTDGCLRETETRIHTESGLTDEQEFIFYSVSIVSIVFFLF